MFVCGCGKKIVVDVSITLKQTDVLINLDVKKWHLKKRYEASQRCQFYPVIGIC